MTADCQWRRRRDDPDLMPSCRHTATDGHESTPTHGRPRIAERARDESGVTSRGSPIRPPVARAVLFFSRRRGAGRLSRFISVPRSGVASAVFVRFGVGVARAHQSPIRIKAVPMAGEPPIKGWPLALRSAPENLLCHAASNGDHHRSRGSRVGSNPWWLTAWARRVPRDASVARAAANQVWWLSANPLAGLPPPSVPPKQRSGSNGTSSRIT